MATYGLYPWTPDYGYRYVHPASRLHFEDVEPLGKVFEVLHEGPGDWLTLRYDDQQYKVLTELFQPFHGPRARLPFGFGDPVRERAGVAGQPPRRGTIADIIWDTQADQPRYTLWLGKRRGERVYEAAELRED